MRRLLLAFAMMFSVTLSSFAEQEPPHVCFRATGPATYCVAEGRCIQCGENERPNLVLDGDGRRALWTTCRQFPNFVPAGTLVCDQKLPSNPQ